jgi:hypothetical protein
MEVIGKLHAPAALPSGRTPVLINHEPGWAPETVWTFWKREKSHAFTGIQSPGYPAHAIPAPFFGS